MSKKWQTLGLVTIDTARLLLLDPVHTELESLLSEEAQFPIPNGDFSGVQVETGIGDGRYRVEGRFIDSPFGRRLGEIRVRFLDENGNWLGGDLPHVEGEKR